MRKTTTPAGGKICLGLAAWCVIMFGTMNHVHAANDSRQSRIEVDYVKAVRVVLPEKPNDLLERIVAVFARQVEKRCPAKVATQGDAPLTVALSLNPALGKEGFRIRDRAGGGIEVVGQNERGVLYGLGKLLRTSRYSKDGFAAGKWRGESVPQKPIRGIYFATHFHNYYHDGPIEEIQRYVEDLALWGFNSLVVWYDMHHFNGFDDPEAVAFRTRLRAILLAAKRIGLDVWLGVVGNEAYGNSPAKLRATPGGGRGGYYPCAVCPSKPEGMRYILKVLGEEFDWAADLKPRSIWIWPYDQGGCGCAACRPWGANGFIKCVEQVGRLARKKLPGTKIVLSSWFMNRNEWRRVAEHLKRNKSLADAILSEPGPHGLRIDPKDLGLPLVGFPEISMHGTFPWGGFGATPLTARARSQWNAVKATHAGGFPYSEGIYEDLTKVVFSQLYWNDRPVEATVKEYIAFEFSPDVVEDVYGVVKTLEQNHHWRWWPGKLEGVKLGMNWFPSRGAKPQADPGAEEAYATMKRVDRLLSPQARKAWRWRQLYLRALLDAELKTNGGKPNDLCNRAFAELIEIYHAQNAEPAVRPPLPKGWKPKAKTTARPATPLRSVQVELPDQGRNVVKRSWPAIGCWFWTAEEFKPDGYKRFVDLHEKHSPFRLLTTSIRHRVEVTDPKVHDQIKAAAKYAKAHDMAIVMDLDVRLARQAFLDKHPDQMQEIVRLREVALAGAGEASIAIKPINLGDHYTFAARGYDTISARVLRVYSYVSSPDGIDPKTVRDITDRCKVRQADAKGVRVAIPCTAADAGRTACVLAAFTLFTPDVFAPHLIGFERGILKQYADVPLAGACKDEWGFPGRFRLSTDDLYFSRHMAKAYAKRRPGRGLVRDLLLMAKAQRGPQGPRTAAINHYMEMTWQRNGEVETEFYKSIKAVFGTQAMMATHPTWFPYPGDKEIFKNGLSWWACKRDLAQTDEGTPYCVRTALSKKWHSPLWYNMYYSKSLEDYDLWSHALGGGRINYHPRWPMPWDSLTTNLLEGDLLQAESRVQLLNYISTAPIDCPVAVVFGHPAATNWAGGKSFADVGMAISNALWKEGYYADLIPSSEIAGGALTVGPDGHIQYGPQRYRAVVLYHPQYERPGVADFFAKAAAQGKTALYRVGDWTTDFDGNAFDGNATLPAGMKAIAAKECARAVIAQLKAGGVRPQTTCSLERRSHTTIMVPKPAGRCRLIDGTVILASGAKDVMGDPIKETVTVRGREVTFDAVGVAAVRLDETGKVEALAAGGLKSFRTDSMTIDLPERMDIALFKQRGRWRGIVQGHDGDLPAALAELTAHWTRLRMPEPRRTSGEQ